MLTSTLWHANSIQQGNYLITYFALYLTLIEPIRHRIVQSLWDNGYTNGGIILGAFALESPEADYYTVLGVDKKATKEEIQKAFRGLAKKYHPDKNKEKNAQDEFIKIFKAYKTLSDEEKRKEYDNRSNMPGGQQGWTEFNMNNFDINEFYRHYREQFYNHAQHHHHAHSHQHNDHYQRHHRTSFGGIDLDDLFHNLDDDEWQSFGNLFGSHDDYHHARQYNGWNTVSSGHFGDGASFFGNLDELHASTGHDAHSGHINIHSGGYSCHTITRQVNGVTMTQTQCS